MSPLQRRCSDDRGFSLLELMVVVLIVAILLAIAIPTFFGARDRASRRAAQVRTRDAHVAEFIYFSDRRQRFTDDLLALRRIEPSVRFTDDLAEIHLGGPYVYVEVRETDRPDDTAIVGSKSRTGECYWIRVIATRGVPRFGENTTCVVPGDDDWLPDWK